MKTIQTKPVTAVLATESTLTFSNDFNQRVTKRLPKTFTPKAPNTSYMLMTPAQRVLYRQIIYGLKDYSKEEIKQIPLANKQIIDALYRKGRAVIHRLKYETYFGKADRLFNSAAVRYMSEEEYDRLHLMDDEDDISVTPLGTLDSDLGDLPSSATLFKLRISIKEVCDALINARLLPATFYDMDPNFK
jgi:hypothetical protein